MFVMGSIVCNIFNQPQQLHWLMILKIDHIIIMIMIIILTITSTPHIIIITVTVTINGLVKLLASNAHIFPSKYPVSFWN